MDTFDTSASLRFSTAAASRSTPLHASARPSAIAEPVAGTISRAAQVADQVVLSRPDKLEQSVRRLVAGAVDQPAIEKQPANASNHSAAFLPALSTYTSRGTLALHTNPSDKNAAATGVALGRTLDINA